MRTLLPLALALLPAPAAHAAGTYRNVTVAQLAAEPDRWDGQRVRVAGLAVRERENFGLYASYEDYCSRGEVRPVAIYVDWPEHLRDGRLFRKPAVVEGIFHKAWPQEPTDDPDMQVIVVSNVAPGPGPLTEVRVVRWTSGPVSRCNVADPEELGGRHVAY